jgi:SAM-dependent methyltransferase
MLKCNNDNKTQIMDNITKTIETYNQIYDDYSQRNGKANPSIIGLRRIFLNLLPKHEGLSILDAGCANGRDIPYFTSKGFKVIGIDLCEPFLRIARKNNPDVLFLNMDLRKLHFPAKTFDGIWAMASLLHIPKKEMLKTLKGFKKVLKPGGVFLLSFMSGENDGLREHPGLHWPERHFSDFQPEELENLIAKSGYKILRTTTKPTSWGPSWLIYFITY